MTRRDKSAGRRRREFLKVAGGVATALVATADALGQTAVRSSIFLRRPQSLSQGKLKLF